MFHSISRKIEIFLAIGTVLMLIVFSIISVLLSKNKTSSQSIIANISPSPIPTSPPQQIPPDLEVVSLAPDTTSVLQPGKRQVFSIVFNHTVALGFFNISITRTGGEKQNTVLFASSLNKNNNTIVLTTNAPLLPFSIYTLTVINNANHANLITASYPTDSIQPTRVPTNNIQLSSFLPYKTSSFQLSYLPSRNIYIFNFFFDPSSQIDVQTQYEQAKNAAIQFIESKGIDINSVVIDWRHS